VNYVAGFLFDDERKTLALVLKQKGPSAVVGKWNAIGGKIEPGESSHAAMWREFLEEAGVDVPWTLFLKLTRPGFAVDFYHAFSSEKLFMVRQKEAEIIQIFRTDNLPVVVPNLRWIIPMALGHEDDHVWVYEVKEKETFAPRAQEKK
jgi:8-oxo-dGTP pyrophosphatase MutT (NUDIX family)